jgi:hypothetical protein
MSDAELNAALDAELPDMGVWLVEHRERLLALDLPGTAELVEAVESAVAGLPDGQRQYSRVARVLGDRQFEVLRAMNILTRQDLAADDPKDLRISARSGASARR